MPGFLNVKLPLTTAKIDDYTVRFTYDEPYYIAPNMFSFGNYGCVGTSHLPKHAYQEWHVKYNPDAEKIAKDADFESWWQFFNSKRIIGIMNPQIPGIPSLGPWVIKDSNPNGAVWERNPYYFKVDPEGNQLPYIDEVIGIYLGDSETNLLRTMNGEFDYVTYALNIDDFPILKENADSAGYDVRIAEGNMVSDVAFRVNWNHVGDPEVAEILYDKRFRQALSVAIDREEVNELVSLGYGIPMQFTLKKDSVIFKQEWADSYAQYDTDLANQLLDEIGMTKRDRDGYRLTPDGKDFEFIVEIMSNSTACVKASELISDYWEAVGIKVNMQIKEIMAVVESLRNKTFMVFGQEMPSWSDLGMITDGIETWNSWAVFNDWWAWRQYNGEQGAEPSEDVKRIFEINALRASVPMEETFRNVEWVFDWVAENLPVIGIMGYTGTPVVWKKDLGNVDHTYPAEGSYRAETFYWKK
jgi:peptide/nickel transport system substrate-binding protein